MLNKSQSEKLTDGYIHETASCLNWIIPFIVNHICWRYFWIGFSDKFIRLEHRHPDIEWVSFTSKGEVDIPIKPFTMFKSRYLHGNIMINPKDNPNAILRWEIQTDYMHDLQMTMCNKYLLCKYEPIQWITIPLSRYRWLNGDYDMITLKIEFNIATKILLVRSVVNTKIVCILNLSKSIDIISNKYLHLTMKLYGGFDNVTIHFHRSYTKKTMRFKIRITNFSAVNVYDLNYVTSDIFWKCRQGMIISKQGNKISGDVYETNSMGNVHGHYVISAIRNPYAIVSWTFMINTNKIWIGIQCCYQDNGLENHYGWFGDVDNNTIAENDLIKMIYDVFKNELIFFRNDKKIYVVHDIDDWQEYHFIICFPMKKCNYIQLIHSEVQNCLAWKFEEEYF